MTADLSALANLAAGDPSFLADLVRRIERLEAAQEITNLMGRFEFLHSAYRNPEIPQLFANRDDVLLEMPYGTYRGRDAAIRSWQGAMHEHIPPRDLTGEYVEHLLTTQVLEVAEDGKTAKGAWISPGAEAHHLGWEEGNPLHAFWYWGRYHAEFIKEDDGWKIWKLRISTTFVADYYGAFTEPDKALSVPPAPPGTDGPPQGQVQYSPTWDPRELPVAPEPYASHPDLSRE